MEEDVTRLLIEETMIADVPQVPIKEIGVALTMDMDLYQILDQNGGAVLNMEEQKALPMTDTTGHYYSLFLAFVTFYIVSVDWDLMKFRYM